MSLRSLCRRGRRCPEAGPFAEGLQPAGGFAGGGAGEVRVLVGVDRGHEVLAAGEGLFAFHLGAEP